MPESVISVCWKDHSSELATVHKSLLKDSFLVDCTLSAEGQSLKAHRLVLSACSPYFHMLFQEETDNHPLVILVDESFHTLQAVIDFMYQGEIHISEGNMKEFMTLAQSLQIKGLNSFTDYKNKNLSRSYTENYPPGPSVGNQIMCEVESINASNNDSTEKYSQQHLHLLDGCSDVAHTQSSLPFEGYRASCEEVQSPQEYQKSPRRDEVSIEAEMTVKHESVNEVFSEKGKEILNKLRRVKHLPENFMCKINEETASTFGCSDSSHGNVMSSVLPTQQQHYKELRKVSSGEDVAEKEEFLLSANLVPKSEPVDDQESEESMDDLDWPGNDAKETFEEKIAVHGEQNLEQPSGAEERRLEAAATRQGGGQRWRPQEKTRASPSGLQERVGRRAGKRLLCCKECPATFTSVNGFKYHVRTHTGERPFSCDVCGSAFSKKSTLATHKRRHTGERPYTCDVCGKGFTMKSNLVTHMHTHTGERPYGCEECGKTFSNKSNLATHMHTHTGARPFSCDMCGNSFANAHHLIYHIRTHTGERPYSCDVCCKTFSQKSNLATHVRTHTGERPFRCEECGCAFVHPSSLAKHKRTHT